MNLLRIVLTCTTFVFGTLMIGSAHVTLQVNVKDVTANLSHFWESTGFCPPQPHQNSSQWFLSDDMTQNLLHISSVPFSGIKQVRIHWLLDAVKISGWKKGVPLYNFTDLDALVDRLWQLKLKPGFEIMGNPSSFFSDFENKTQVYMWKDLVLQIARRYVDTYGLKYVSSWNFEVWNEPDGHDFDRLKFTVQGFLNYVDACVEGLKAVSPVLKVGVPGGSCRDRYLPKKFCWATLIHVLNGTNYFTGKQDIQVAFLSFHRKGTEPDNTEEIMFKELETYYLLGMNLSNLIQLPFFNDEGDPLVGWSHDRWWRADVTYAAMVVKVIAVHQNKWLSANKGVRSFTLLSNDNGFLSYNPYFFTQRTLTARFQMNNTSPTHVELIRKPVLSAMGLLSYLGEKQIKATVNVSGVESRTVESIGAVATVHEADPLSQQDSWQAAVILYYSEDTYNVSSSVKTNLSFLNIPNTDLRYLIYQVNNKEVNPYQEWLNLGSPKKPSLEDFKHIREKENPVRLSTPKSYTNNVLEVTLHLPGVILLHICAKAVLQPDQVTEVSVHNITSGKVLISWDDGCVNTKCIKTYEVHYSAVHAGPYSRVNEKDLIFNSFVYERTNVSGFYKVKAIDYWNRAGEFSLIAQYPQT